MHYTIVCRDVASSAEARRLSLADHRDYVDTNAGSIVVSGALLADDNVTRVGQLFVVDVADRAAAERFVVEDPFYENGIFADVEIWPMALRFQDGTRSTSSSPS